MMAYYMTEAIMDDFFPFIHKHEKKKDLELEPLYIEIMPPLTEREHEDAKKEEESKIIIIQL
jgi:hypothetical protein